MGVSGWGSLFSINREVKILQESLDHTRIQKPVNKKEKKGVPDLVQFCRKIKFRFVAFRMLSST